VKLSDGTLVQGCQAGDRHAWEALILRYERLLWGIALRCGLSEDDADDVFQTVCVKLLDNLDKLRDDGHLKGWLITTAKHEAWRVQRLRRRQVSLSDGDDESYDALEAQPADDPLPGEVLLHMEEEQMVRLALEELGDNCRTLIRLLYHSDPICSYSEIARIMQISEGAIGPTRARCLQKLKKILLQQGF